MSEKNLLNKITDLAEQSYQKLEHKVGADVLAWSIVGFSFFIHVYIQIILIDAQEPTTVEAKMVAQFDEAINTYNERAIVCNDDRVQRLFGLAQSIKPDQQTISFEKGFDHIKVFPRNFDTDKKRTFKIPFGYLVNGYIESPYSTISRYELREDDFDLIEVAIDTKKPTVAIVKARFNTGKIDKTTWLDGKTEFKDVTCSFPTISNQTRWTD
jgi:hypothetical protein